MVEMGDWHRSTQRVVAAASERGLEIEVRRFPEGTRTARDAARAIGCDVAAICKSIVLSTDDGPVVVFTSGANRVDMGKVEGLVGRAGVRRANADEVKSATGQSIGGTAPFGHPGSLTMLVDEDLLALQEVWAAAGTPDTVFGVAPQTLVDATGARVADVAA
jgi:prolyl-tRNA editing enzyme YbaK/EbsC (Cys-tRNA(Pro) deacylase)